MPEIIDKTNNKSNINQIFSDIDQSLANAIADESFENAVEIAKSVIQLLGFEKDSINQKLVRFEKLQNTSNDSWTHKAPGYTDRKASYELASDNNKNIDFKIYWVKKSSKRIIANLVALTPNFEDEEDIYIKKNIGIDFVVPSEADRLIIILSKNYKIRTLELHKNLSNTQKKIFEKWVQDFDYSNKAQFHQILWDSFDIQPLNKEFYKEIASLFAEQVQHLVINKILDDEHAKQFTTRLIGRLIFCWFLRRKNIIAEEFQYFETANKDATQYYHEKLERLFFEVLNTPLSDRETVRYSSSKQQTRLISEKKPQKQLFEIDQQTPFLNGGLFDPKESDLYAQNKITFPQDYFQRFIKGFLDKYNFTTDESTSDFQQVAIDPEMLGRIFENLLAEQSDDTGAQARKSKGAFYTPREIVDYMCKESLRQYLSTKLGDDSRKEQILSLLLDKKEHNFDYKNDSADLKPYKATLVQALDDLKLLDPACGSGAFPIGMLQVILATYVRLDRRYESYRTKKQIIQENIYGVDIEPTAVEIARLRTWLSLIVDVELKPNSSNCGVDPLPNLDFKFVCANSLIPLAPNGQLSLLDDAELEKTIKSIRDDYFSSTSTKQKKNLQKQYEDLISENLLYHNGNGMSERQKQLRTYHPFDSDNVSQFFDSHFIFGVDGFDIVIGNPPYIKEYTNKTAFDGLRDCEYYEGKMDLWYLFACHGLDWLNDKGIQCYIATSNWITNKGASKLRNKICKDARIIEFIDFDNYKVFESADIQTMIYFLKKEKNESYKFQVKKLSNSDIPKDNLDLFIKSRSESRDYEVFPFNFDNSSFIDKYFNFTGETLNSVLDKLQLQANFSFEKDEIATGIDVHQDFLNKKNASLLGSKFKVGQGIFVISDLEKDKGKFSKKETSLIKPYFTTNELHRYWGTSENQLWLLYTPSSMNKVINDYPKIKSHLDQFKEIITSDFGPYGLHRARKEDFFKGEKIISLRKCDKYPIFTYTDFDCYVAQTFFVIKTTRINLKYLTAILNSKLIQFWLRHRGKMQGKNYQVDKVPLLNIPVRMNTKFEQKLIERVESILSIAKEKKYQEAEIDNVIQVHQDKIDNLVYELYDITASEKLIIEESLNG